MWSVNGCTNGRVSGCVNEHVSGCVNGRGSRRGSKCNMWLGWKVTLLYVHLCIMYNGCMGVSVGVSVDVSVGMSLGVAVGVAVSGSLRHSCGGLQVEEGVVDSEC